MTGDEPWRRTLASHCWQDRTGIWWVRSGITNLEVHPDLAPGLVEALTTAGGPVDVEYVETGLYPHNRITELRYPDRSAS